MATKSILKSITIKSPASARSLIEALEHASKKSSKEVEFSRPVNTATDEDIQKMFGEKDDRI